MEDLKECFLCKDWMPNENSNLQSLNHRLLCASCFEKSVKRMPAKADTVPQIPKEVPVPELVCNQHSKKLKLFCENCQQLLCSKCVFIHNFHKFNIFKSLAQKIFKDLRNLEFAILFSKASAEEKFLFEELHTLLINEFNQLKVSDQQVIISRGNTIKQKIYVELQNLNADFVNVPLKYCKKICKYGRGLLNELSIENLLHWIEWNEKTLHLFHISTYERKTVSFAMNFIAPFYCRSVLLPYSRIFLCGGRKASGEPGLKKNYIISLEDNFGVTELPEMHEGRSNHLVIYCNDNIFVIGGCDSLNKYTSACERFDLREHQWKKIADLNEKKDTVGGCGIAHLNCLYVFGGRGPTHVRTVEKYSINENVWCLTSMQMPYDSGLHGVCPIPCMNKIIIFAGQHGDVQPHSLFCEADINENKIVDLGNMNAKGNCVVDHPGFFAGRIFSFIFEGYSIRSLVGFDCEAKLWCDLETIL